MSDNNNTENRIRKLLSSLAEKENYYLSESFEKVGIDEDLTNIGINSISFIKMIVTIESEFGIEIDDENLDVGKISTLRKVIEIIDSALKQDS